MKLKRFMTLVTILLSLTACAHVAPVIKDWCVNDKWMCFSQKDTQKTQDGITTHNVGYGTACPTQPQICK